jgi:hypothetical protein
MSSYGCFRMTDEERARISAKKKKKKTVHEPQKKYPLAGAGNNGRSLPVHDAKPIVSFLPDRVNFG